MPIDFNDRPTEALDETAETQSGDGAIASELANQLTAVTADRDQLAAAKADFQDRYLRRTAEFENYRRRVEREKSEFLEYASSEAVTALLPVLDDLERALKHESADKEYVRGMEIIYNRLLETLKKLGLEPISSLGQSFDPYLHQAVDRVETTEAEDHTILQEYQRGYNFKGRLLRPAMVQVAVNPGAKAE
jgi:molecular chaperone GrpE